MSYLGLNHSYLLVYVESLLPEFVIKSAQLTIDFLMPSVRSCVILEHKFQILQGLRIVLVLQVKNLYLSE